MPYNITNTLWTQTFQQTSIFGFVELISIPIIIISLALITRDLQKWKTLAFPVAVGWYISGIRMHFLILIILALMFIIEVISLQTLGNILDTITTRATTGIKNMKEDKTITRLKAKTKSKIETNMLTTQNYGRKPTYLKTTPVSTLQTSYPKMIFPEDEELMKKQ